MTFCNLSFGSSEADFVKDIVKEVKRVIEVIRLEEKENNSGKHSKREGKQVSVIVYESLLYGTLALLWFMILNAQQIPNPLQETLGTYDKYKFSLFIYTLQKKLIALKLYRNGAV